jgi:hypothetical protein
LICRWWQGRSFEISRAHCARSWSLLEALETPRDPSPLRRQAVVDARAHSLDADLAGYARIALRSL